MSQSPISRPTAKPAPEFNNNPHPEPKKKSQTTPSDLQQANAEAAAAQIAYFRSIPWCAAHLTPSTPGSPPLIIDQSLSRYLQPPHSQNYALLSRTLNTPETIPAYVAFHAPPTAPGAPVREVKALVALGPGVDSWGGICHGGIAATLLDEAVGRVVEVNQRLGGGPGVREGALLIVTRRLDLEYLKPVRTGSVKEPRVVLVTGRLVKVEGRKYSVEGVIRGAEGEVLVTVKAVMLAFRGKL